MEPFKSIENVYFVGNHVWNNDSETKSEILRTTEEN